MVGDGLLDGARKVFVLERAVPQIPQASAKFLPAGEQRALGDAEEPGRRGRVTADCLFRRVDLERDAGQRLGDGVVDLDGEARALVEAQVRLRLGDLGQVQRPPASLYHPMENAVPDEDGDDKRRQRADQRAEPPWRPPRRTRDDLYVVCRPRNDGDSPYAREGLLREEVLEVDDADADCRYPAASGDAVVQPAARTCVQGDQVSSAGERRHVVAHLDDLAGDSDQAAMEPGLDLMLAVAAGEDFFGRDVCRRSGGRGLPGECAEFRPDEVDVEEVRAWKAKQGGAVAASREALRRGLAPVREVRADDLAVIRPDKHAAASPDREHGSVDASAGESVEGAQRLVVCGPYARRVEWIGGRGRKDGDRVDSTHQKGRDHQLATAAEVPGCASVDGDPGADQGAGVHVACVHVQRGEIRAVPVSEEHEAPSRVDVVGHDVHDLAGHGERVVEKRFVGKPVRFDSDWTQRRQIRLSDRLELAGVCFRTAVSVEVDVPPRDDDVTGGCRGSVRGRDDHERASVGHSEVAVVVLPRRHDRAADLEALAAAKGVQDCVAQPGDRCDGREQDPRCRHDGILP